MFSLLRNSTPYQGSAPVGGRCQFEFASVTAFSFLSPRCVRYPKQLRWHHDLTNYGFRGLRLLAVNGTTTVDFRLFVFSRRTRRHRHGFPAAAGRYVPFSRSRSPRFSQAFRRERTVPFSLVSFLLSLAAPPSLVRRFCGREAFGSSLKGIPPKRPLVPGGASTFWVREQSLLLNKKRNSYA
jgi:hypothetical protein